ncbi:hypothetical protein AAV99_06550 [Aurantiacibacter marinus]|uniref:Uncharacterized protein n=2 Tax=Aurantiacibacter marinus TaxID=874156 RepID=A0A0H0XT34_9SPHN|nr:hypothetical protein AAV99_06550 [Aurantiacibacter marinus]
MVRQSVAPSENGETEMKFPSIDLASLPDLNTLTGMFGSGQAQTPGHDDTIIVLATMLYDAMPPTTTLF